MLGDPMKLKLTLKLLILAAMTILSFQAKAWISSNPKDQLYTFKFHLKGETYEYNQAANTYEEAFTKAARACYSHYKGDRHLTEDAGLDIIDVCANPRSI
jgi:hypothetical protein